MTDTKKKVIWSYEIELDEFELEEMREGYGEKYSDNDLYEIQAEANYDYLEELRAELDMVLDEPIIIIADLGLWNGRVNAYAEIVSCNVKDCFRSEYDPTWYVDKYGDLRCDAVHHDGTNHYLYRVFKDDISEFRRDKLKEKILDGTVKRSDITAITKSIGSYVQEAFQ